MAGIRPRIAPTMTYGIQGTNIYSDVIQGATQLMGIVQQGRRDVQNAEFKREGLDMQKAQNEFNQGIANSNVEQQALNSERTHERQMLQLTEQKRANIAAEGQRSAAQMASDTHRANLLTMNEEQQKTAHARWQSEYTEKYGGTAPSFEQVMSGDGSQPITGEPASAPLIKPELNAGKSNKERNQYNQEVFKTDNAFAGFLGGTAGQENELDAQRAKTLALRILKTSDGQALPEDAISSEYINDPSKGGRGYKMTMDPKIYDQLKAGGASPGVLSFFRKSGEPKEGDDPADYKSDLVSHRELRDTYSGILDTYDTSTPEGAAMFRASAIAAMKTVGLSDTANRNSARGLAGSRSFTLHKMAADVVPKAMKTPRFLALDIDPELYELVAIEAQRDIAEQVRLADSKMSGADHPDLISGMVAPFETSIENAIYKAGTKAKVKSQGPEFIAEAAQMQQAGSFGHATQKKPSQAAAAYAQEHVLSVSHSLRLESATSPDPLTSTEINRIELAISEALSTRGKLSDTLVKLISEKSEITYNQIKGLNIGYFAE